MSEPIGTAGLLRSLGIDPMTVERVVFDHTAGKKPTLTVWLVPNAEQMERFVSDFTAVYELAVRGE